MGELHACAYMFVFLVWFQVIAGKPFFGNLWCDMFCDDDDVSTPTSTEDYDDFFCEGCTPRRRPTAVPTAPTSFARPGDMNIMIPPSNGLNLTMSQINGMWTMNMVPWLAVPSVPGAAAPAPVAAAPPAAPPAPATPPAGATPAPAAATTPAAPNTVAPTTAAAG